MAIGKTLKKLLGGIAPTLATAIGGPMGGVAMKFLADKFTGGDTGKVEDFLLSANPEVLAKLKLADKDFDIQMRKLDIDLEKISLENVEGARDLAKKTTIWPQVTLSAVFIIGYFYMMYLFVTSDLWAGLSDFAKGQIAIMIGVLTAGITQVMNFWFGSSSGSKEKTKAIAK